MAEKKSTRPAKDSSPTKKVQNKSRVSCNVPAPLHDVEPASVILERYNGRPTKYSPEMCEKVVVWGAQGKSRTWMAASLMICRATLDNWSSQHPEFLDAIKIARALEQKFWEDDGQIGMRTQGFGQAIWSRNMASRFPGEWTEKKDSTITINPHEDWLKKVAHAAIDIEDEQ